MPGPARKKRKKGRAGIGNKTDLTAKLPDEVLCHVFSFMSLSDQLRLEAVSKRYQRCIITYLNANPQPFMFHGYNKSLNGYKASSLDQVLYMVASFAKKTKFDRIEFNYMHSDDYNVAWLDPILSVLTSSENQCLSRVTTYETEAAGSQRMLQDFLDKSGKLTTLKLNVDALPLNGERATLPWCRTFLMDVGQVLKDRPLSELKVILNGYAPQDLVPILQTSTPNTLRKIDLDLREMRMMNLSVLVDGLRGNAWSVLEDMRLCCGDVYHLDGSLDEFYKSLTRLPELIKCHLEFYNFPPNNDEVFPGVVSLFKSGIQATTTVIWNSNNLTGCQIRNLIAELQHTEIQLRIDKEIGDIFELRLVLDHVFYETYFSATRCNDANCFDCRHSYANLMEALDERIYEPGHLAGHQLDQSKFGCIVDDFNRGYGGDWASWRAVSAHANDTHDIVTITFRVDDEEDFDITIDLGHCLSNPCVH